MNSCRELILIIQIQYKNMKNVEQMKRKLLSIREIEFNEPHMSIRMEQRGVRREHILSNLRFPSKLAEFTDMGERENGRKKYKLYFNVSKKRILWIMVSINSKIKNINYQLYNKEMARNCRKRV